MRGLGGRESGLDQDPYQEKYNFTSRTQVPAIRIEYMITRLKGISVKISLSLRLMAICGCGLLPIRPKSQNSNIRHDGTLNEQEFNADVEKPHGLQF
jgi:hypothetical protein